MKINKRQIAYLEGNYGKNILPLTILENEIRPGSKPMEIILFYKKETSLLKIKESLFKAIKHYNLFSSRLIMIDDNKFALQYCADGVEFNILPSINDTLGNINIDDIKKMMVHVKTLPGEPLLAVTGIPIKDGLLGGISCSEAIADVFSLILFFFAWKCTIEGKSFPLPSTQRLFKGNPVSSDKIDKVFTPPLSELNDKIQTRVKLKNINLYSKREFFSDEFLNEIMNKAKLENAKYTISNNQIITSFLLKKYHDHILPDTDKIVLRSPVNFRDVHPDIDSMYIGNAFFDNTTEFTKDEINKMSIYEIAYLLKKSITKTKNENYVKKISYLSKYGIEFKPDIFKKYRSLNIDTDIVSSNLIHLNDPESLGLSSSLVSILHLNSTVQTSFIMLKEKSGELFTQITSSYPFT
jgi:Transferase family.